MLLQHNETLRRRSRLLVTLLLVLLAATSCAAEPAPPATLAPLTPGPPPASLPPPAPVDPIGEADALLRANPDPRCASERSLFCDLPWSVRLLEHLRRYPDSPRRPELSERIADLLGQGGRLALDGWVAPWLDQALRQPIEAAGGHLPQDLAERWRERGEIRVTDLDNDGLPDYLVTYQIGPQSGAERTGGLVWLHRAAATYRLESLPTLVDGISFPLQPDLLAVRDLNGDGRTDLAYRLTTCGAATCFEHLRLFSWRDGAWWDLMPAHWSTTNGSWTLRDRGGVVELVGQHRPPGYDLGPLVAYQVHFAPITGEFAPVEVSSDLSPTLGQGSERQAAPGAQLDTDATLLQWSQRLTYASRLNEALTFIQPVAERDGAPAPDGAIDFRPYALLRLGMAHLLRQDVAAAHQAWRTLERRFPASPVAAAVGQLRPLAQRPQDVWRVCAALRGLAPAWQLSVTGGGYVAAFRWRDQCDPRVLLALNVWRRDEAIDTQLARLGLGWRLLSEQYDLNDDGVADPLGVLDFGGERSPWAWLSEGAQYRPLFAAQSFPLGASGLETEEEFTDIQGVQNVRVTDLDGNGTPELVLAEAHGFFLMEWSGDRFRRHHEAFDPGPPWAQASELIRTGRLRIEPQGDGAFELQALLSDAQGREAGVWRYRLREGRLTRTSPPAGEPPALGRAIAALFQRDDPQEALRVLVRFQPEEPAQAGERAGFIAWQLAAADYLRGLALDYGGERGAAQAVWRSLAQRDPESSWGLLAAEKLR